MGREIPPGSPPSESKPALPCGCLPLILASVAVFLFVRTFIAPASWVEVRFGPFPEGIPNYCLIAEDSDGIRPMNWYVSMVIAHAWTPFPRDELANFITRPDGDGYEISAVEWTTANRYGLLTRGRDHRWRLWWLKPDEVTGPSISRYLIGQGRAEVRVPPIDRAEVPSESLLDHLRKFR